MSQFLPPPRWALRKAAPGDRAAAARAWRDGVLRTNWEPFALVYAELKLDAPPREWAETHGWRASWWAWFWNADRVFLGHMLESDEHFELALAESDVELYLPKAEHTLSADDLWQLDTMYEATEDQGAGRRPSRWGELVAALREIRRAVEAGVVVKVDGRTLSSWGAFYAWAHERYGALEDGYDDWIGDDR